MEFIVWIFAGAAIGLLARLFMPGQDPIGCLGTIFIGISGGVIGGELWRRYINPDNDGIAWIGSILAAMVLLGILRSVTYRRR